LRDRENFLSEESLFYVDIIMRPMEITSFFADKRGKRRVLARDLHYFVSFPGYGGVSKYNTSVFGSIGEIVMVSPPRTHDHFR